jgi:hypothetical protein
MSRYYPQISTVLEVSKVMSIFPGSESLQSLIPGWSVARSLIITRPGKHTKNFGKSMKITIFDGNIHYFDWAISIAILT